MKNDALAQGLLEAIKSEVEGHHFYLMASRSTMDPQGREVFERLAREEMEHVRFLKAQYQSFLNADRPDANVRLTKSIFSLTSPIFSENIKTRIHEAHYEMTAISIGIQLELSSIQFYRSQSQKIDNPEAKKFYEELAAWETTHYNMLLHQQDALKQDYWHQSEFSPF